MLHKKIEFLSREEKSAGKEYSAADGSGTELTGSEGGFRKERTDDSNCRCSLFQESFFFCDVRNVGDVHGTGCIFVETVVDSKTGCAFAKVFPRKNALNAVDILSSRVLPYFKELGFAVRGIYTRKIPEYCGLAPLHPYEHFLASSHIQHLSINQPGKPYSYLCIQFYQFLQREFFQPALRKTFLFTLDELQVDLDAFLKAFNAMQRKRFIKKIVPDFLP